MTNYWTTFSLLFKYAFKRDKSKGNGWKLLLLIFPFLMALVFALVLIASVAYFMPLVYENSLHIEIATYAVFLTIFVVFILGLIPTINYLYLSKDTEFFASLPIGTSAVYMAKLTFCYCFQLVLAAIIMLPIIITTGIVLNMGIIFYVFMILLFLATPICPLLLMSILSIPIMHIVTFFKRRAAFTSIFLILMFGGIYAAYFLILGNSTASGEVTQVDPDAVLLDFARSVSGLVDVLAPLSSLIRVAFGDAKWAFGKFDSVFQSSLANFATFILFFVVAFLITYFLSSKIYMSGATAQLESQKSALKKNAKDKNQSVFWALAGKEFKEVLRTPAFAFACLPMIIMSPILTMVMTNSFKIASQINLEAVEFTGMANSIFELFPIMIMSMFCVGVNVGSSTIMSREGDKFYMVKIMPVDYHTQIRAKLFMHRVISTISIVLCLVVYVAMSKLYLSAILAFVYMFVYSSALTYFVALFDLSKPKLKWNTPNEVMRRNINVQVPTMVSMSMSIVIGVMAIIWYGIGTSGLLMDSIVVELTMWAIMYVVAFGFLLLFSSILKAKRDKFIDRVEV